MLYNRNSTSIAPAGYRTGDWSWRDKITEGDLVDAFDIQGNWILSTVLKTRITEANGKAHQECLIGYRIYIKDGTKKDSQKRPNEGWSEEHDTWFPAYSIMIQKYCLSLNHINRPNSITKKGTIYCRKMLDTDPLVIKDSSDVLEHVFTFG